MKLKNKESCPCGSGKKYRRCCGASETVSGLQSWMQKEVSSKSPEVAATASQAEAEKAEGAVPPMTPEMQAQFQSLFQRFQQGGKAEAVTRLMKRLPKSYLRDFSNVFQKAMQGKDVQSEWAALQAKLPASFQEGWSQVFSQGGEELEESFSEGGAQEKPVEGGAEEASLFKKWWKKIRSS